MATTGHSVPQADAYSSHERRRKLIAGVEELLRRYYPPAADPYRIFEREITSFLQPAHSILDAGCGASAALLRMFAPQCAHSTGVDEVEFANDAAEDAAEHRVRLINARLEDLPLEPASVDLVFSRSVLEHLADPSRVFSEFVRVLKPGGRFVFITPNVWSYPVAAARLVPNRFHAAIVDWAEGRPDADTFATFYRTNSMRAVRRSAVRAGFEVTSLRYLGMFPNYLMFHPLAFRIGVGYERLVGRWRPLHFLQHWILGVLTKPGHADCNEPAASAAVYQRRA